MINYQTIALELSVEGNFPKVVRPDIGEHLGNSQNKKEFFITKQNQMEYSAKYSSDDITVLDKEFNNNYITIHIVPYGNVSCEVLDSSIYVDDLGIGKMSLIVNMPHSSIDEMVELKIDSLTYLDENDGNIYICKVVECEWELLD